MADERRSRIEGTTLPDEQARERTVRDPADRPDGSGKSGRRRRFVIAGIVVAVLLLLVVLPGYLAMRPGFFGRYPSLSAEYQPWSTSTHVETGCEQCHVPPKVLPRVAYQVKMVGVAYLSLVSRSRAPKVFGKPTNEACLDCHDDLRSVSPQGDLQIPHRAHVSVLKMDCVECHNYLVHERNPAGKHTPTMKGCLRCHDGDTAKNTCTTCHTEKAVPESHRAKDWLIVHPQKADDPECSKCHNWTANWCVDCHSRRPQSHGANWRTVHGDQVKKHRNCEACHNASFCIRCHGEVPKLNFNPALQLVK